MGPAQNLDWHRAAASALDWWHMAGVDTLVAENPRDWTATVARARPPHQRDQRTRAPGPAAPNAPAPMPATLETFLAWRYGPDAPEAQWPGTPIAPTGDPGAAIMVVVDVPDRDDTATGALLSGESGRLFDRMLAAIGLDRAAVHLAPMCRVRPVAGRITPEIETRLIEIVRHQVALIAPRRLLILGNAPSRAFTGMDVARARGSLQSINLTRGESFVTVDMVASFHPRLLLERPADKARAWKDLQMLIAGLEA